MSPPLLKRVTAWPKPVLKPNLVIVLVDADGDKQRRNRLHGSVRTLGVPTVLGVAVQEFEAWLVADVDRVEQLLGREPPLDRSLLSSSESLEPRGSKRALQQWIARSDLADEEERVTRRRIAEALDLEVLRSSCRAFGQFASELSRVR